MTHRPNIQLFRYPQKLDNTFYLTGIFAHKVNNIKLLDDEETGNTIYGSEPLGELHKYALLVRAVGESNNVLFLTRRKPS